MAAENTPVRTPATLDLHAGLPLPTAAVSTHPPAPRTHARSSNRKRRYCHRPSMNFLLIIFLVNMFLLVFGVFISWLDIRSFGSGLYLVLVSTVTVVIVLAFCLVGTEEQTEPTVAKQMWSKSRQTIRRYTTVRRNSGELQANSKNVSTASITATNRAIASAIKVESSAPRKPTSVRYNLPSDDENTSSPTPTASTSEPSVNAQTERRQCVVQFHSDNSTNNDSAAASCENTVIYL